MTAPRSIENSISEAKHRAVDGLHRSDRAVAAALRAQLDWIKECDRLDLWRDDGCRDFTHWIATELQISQWHARRRINAAHTLSLLPTIDAAFMEGRLSFDKVLELCRFATADDEDKLAKWAASVTTATVRQRADVETRRRVEEALEIERSRYVHIWNTSDGWYGFEGRFPGHEGAVIAKALDRLADRTPDIMEEDDDGHTPHDVALEVRRADALYQLATAKLSADQDIDRGTVVVHADLDALVNKTKGCEIENGPAIHAETALRLACDARIEVVLHNELGDVVGVGRRHREPPAWMLRQLRHRDRGCRFPGCEMKRFLHAHHIQHWSRGGPTDLDNLLLVCHFHHKLVHEYGWEVELLAGGHVRWLRPGGKLHRSSRAENQVNKADSTLVDDAAVLHGEDAAQMWDDFLVVRGNDAAGAARSRSLDRFEDSLTPSPVLVAAGLIGEENAR